MESPTNIVQLRQPEDIDDPLTEVVRAGALRLLAQAVELEAEAFLSAMQDLRFLDGRVRQAPTERSPAAAPGVLGPVRPAARPGSQLRAAESTA